MFFQFLILLIAIAVLRVNPTHLTENNACASLKDYYTIHNNKHCWYDIFTDLEMPELLKSTGRAFEEHKVVTSDGHILTVFRMSNADLPNRKKTPVFLQHGLVSSAKHWVSLGNDSLAFQLNNRGFDVWLGNYRGSKYSTEHTAYTVDNEAYWEHTIDDLALIDLPSMLNTVQTVTGAKGIIYVGHSLGGTMALMYTSEFPQIAKRIIKASVLVAPAYKLTHTITPIRILEQFADVIWDTVKKYRLMKVASYGPISNGLIRLVCFQNPKTLATCMQLASLIYGPKNGIKAEQFPNLLKQQFTGTSIKITYHFVSLLRGMFSKYDFATDNLKIYGQTTPPSYNVTNIEIPTMIVYAKSDWLTTKMDALQLFEDMNKKYIYNITEVPEENFNHVDFLFGSTAKLNFIDPVIKHIETIDKS